MTDPVSSETRASRPWMGHAKIAVSLALLVLLAWQLDVEAMFEELRATPLSTMIWIGAIICVQVIVSNIRWWRVLAHLECRDSFRRLLADNLVGRALNLVLPTQVGGDVVRGLRAKARLGSRNAWASILFERMLGLLTLALIPAAALLIWQRDVPEIWLWGCGAVVINLVVALLFIDRVLERFGHMASSIPRIAVLLHRLTDALRGGLSSWSARLETVLWSAIVHGLNLTMLLLVGSEWSQPDLVSAILIGVPIAIIGAMVPISFGGFGVREGLFVVTLGLLGIESDRALALSVVWILALVPPAIVGIGVLAFERTS